MVSDLAGPLDPARRTGLAGPRPAAWTLPPPDDAVSGPAYRGALARIYRFERGKLTPEEKAEGRY